MNGSPHTHEVIVTPDRWGGATVTYGDQTRDLSASDRLSRKHWRAYRKEGLTDLSLASRAEHWARKLIARHDDASRREGERFDSLQRVADRLNALVLRKPATRGYHGAVITLNAWGSELVAAGATTVPEPDTIDAAKVTADRVFRHADGRETILAPGLSQAESVFWRAVLLREEARERTRIAVGYGDRTEGVRAVTTDT